VLTGATMEMGGTQGPATVVTDVTLTIASGALVVAPPPPASPTSVAWPSVAEARCGEPGLLLDGSPAVAVSAFVGGRFVRWLVPAHQLPPERATAIDELLTTRTGRVPGEPSSLAPGPVAGAGEPEIAPPAAPRGPGRRERDSSQAGGSRHVTAETPPGTQGAPSNGHHPLAAASSSASEHEAALPPAVLEALMSTGSRRPRRRGLLGSGVAGVLWMAVAVLFVIGAAVLGSGLVAAPPTSTGGKPGSTPDRSTLRAVGVRLVDLPTGWTVSSTPKGPLSGFVGGAGVTAVGVAAHTAQHVAIASQYDRCMGVARSRSFLFGAGSSPLAHGASPAFAGPSTATPLEVASRTAVYGSATTVRRGATEFASPRFASCFGTAVGRELRLSATASGSGSALVPGAAKVVELPLPKWSGVHATGVDVSLPLQFHGSETTVELGFVFVTGGRIESTLLTFSTTQFPADLIRALVATLEEQIASHTAH
jgi:hypothetical protein